MKKQIRNEFEKKKEEYINAVLKSTSLRKELYELQKKVDNAKADVIKLEWEYWKALDNALSHINKKVRK